MSEVTPGRCAECGEADRWECDGRLTGAAARILKAICEEVNAADSPLLPGLREALRLILETGEG